MSQTHPMHPFSQAAHDFELAQNNAQKREAVGKMLEHGQDFLPFEGNAQRDMILDEISGLSTITQNITNIVQNGLATEHVLNDAGQYMSNSRFFLEKCLDNAQHPDRIAAGHMVIQHIAERHAHESNAALNMMGEHALKLSNIKVEHFALEEGTSNQDVAFFMMRRAVNISADKYRKKTLDGQGLAVIMQAKYRMIGQADGEEGVRDEMDVDRQDSLKSQVLDFLVMQQQKAQVTNIHTAHPNVAAHPHFKFQ